MPRSLDVEPPYPSWSTGILPAWLLVSPPLADSGPSVHGVVTVS